jgi:hypothetical protein
METVATLGVVNTAKAALYSSEHYPTYKHIPE